MKTVWADNSPAQSMGRGGTGRGSRDRLTYPAPDRQMPQRCKRLVVFAHGDFTLLENGAQRRTAELIHFLRKRFTDVLVYSYVEHPTNSWRPESELRFSEMFAGVELVLDKASNCVRWLTRLKNAALAVRPQAVTRVLRWSVPGATHFYRKMCSQPDEYIFIVNFVDAYTILNGFPFNSLVETHDIKFLKFAKRADRSVSNWRVFGKLRSESALLSHAEHAIAISEADATIIDSLAPGANSFVIPSYHDGDLPASSESEKAPGYDFLFVGAHNNFNVDGLVDYLTNAGRWIRSHTLAIAGHVCEAPRLQALAKQWPRMYLLGFLDDLAPLYSDSRIALAPVDGTGLKIKVLEALAHGLPVLGSRHALRALPPGYGECAFPLDRRIADALLDSPECWRRARASAREFYDSLKMQGDREVLVQFLIAERVAPRPDEIVRPSSVHVPRDGLA